MGLGPGAKSDNAYRPSPPRGAGTSSADLGGPPLPSQDRKAAMLARERQLKEQEERDREKEEQEAEERRAKRRSGLSSLGPVQARDKKTAPPLPASAASSPSV